MSPLLEEHITGMFVPSLLALLAPMPCQPPLALAWNAWGTRVCTASAAEDNTGCSVVSKSKGLLEKVGSWQMHALQGGSNLVHHGHRPALEHCT